MRYQPFGKPGLAPAVAALLVWAGVAVGMVAIGGMIALLTAPLGDFNRVVLPIADGLLIALGALLLAGVNPFARLPQPSPGALDGRGPTLGAFLYGLVFVPIAVPCSGPFLVSIFASSLTIGDALGRLTFFVSLGIGFVCRCSCLAAWVRCAVRSRRAPSAAMSGRCSWCWAPRCWRSACGT
jgi:cytochrome c biogenesis protein CcdA